MTVQPTAVSLAGGGIYLAVALLCLLAARSVRNGIAAERTPAGAWVGIGFFFVLLAFGRAFVIEDRFDNMLRDLARESGLYEGRVEWQAPLTALALVALTILLALMVRAWFRTQGKPRERALATAHLAAAAMLGLIAIRLISFHPVDSLLYGGMRLNWWIDIGLSLLVGGAAWIEWRSNGD